MDDDTVDLPALAAEPANREVLAYLEGRSAHSDVVEDLLTSVGRLGDVRVYCPDPSRYRSVAVTTGGVVFGFALGMSEVGLRVGPLLDRAVATGAEPLPEAGDGWAKFVLFRPDRPRVDLEFWARQAHAVARVRPSQASPAGE